MTEPSKKRYFYLVNRKAMMTQDPVEAWSTWQYKRAKDWCLDTYEILPDGSIEFVDCVDNTDTQYQLDEYFQEYVAPARIAELEKTIIDAKVELAALQDSE